MVNFRKFLMILVFLALGQYSSYCQSLIYRPVNPAFGGNPNNYSWMLGSAESQNIYKSTRSTGSGLTPTNSLDNFTDNLTRQILSKISSSILTNQFGEDTFKVGSYQYGDLKVDISNGQDGVNIRIVDNKGGETIKLFHIIEIYEVFTFVYILTIPVFVSYFFQTTQRYSEC